jgi:hypothetical protein
MMRAVAYVIDRAERACRRTSELLAQIAEVSSERAARADLDGDAPRAARSRARAAEAKALLERTHPVGVAELRAAPEGL